MRLFQNSGITKSYFPRLNRLAQGDSTFGARLDTFLNDRFGASHFLKPVLDRKPTAFFTNGDDEVLQRAWASEQGMQTSTKLTDILLAQIEAHKTEVFYNLDPIHYGNDFVKRLPGCVKTHICWRAAPSNGQDFSAYHLRVCNFPSILKNWEAAGQKSAYFFPAYDPVMDQYAESTERLIDVAFVGAYSRHHQRRARILEAVANLAPKFNEVFCLDRSFLAKLASTPLGFIPPFRTLRFPKNIAAIWHPPVFGRDLYSLFSRSKIVINAAIDMAGEDRGNMRCFEATGCGALLLSDKGNYPEGFQAGVTFLNYENAESACNQVIQALENPADVTKVARQGWEAVRSVYSKEQQWLSFQRLVENV